MQLNKDYDQLRSCGSIGIIVSAFAYSYDSWYRADTLRPVDAITDTVNDLGIKILQQYTAHGNVAFSPTGVAFVLAALYEGSAGRGSKQIAEIMELPLSRDFIRIGFRDIHRRLRSYLNADDFLGGLTLSRENIKLRTEYKDILRFYGFDLSSIEQEANVIVNIKNSNTTEVSMTTIGIIAPEIKTEIISNNIPVVTTMSMDTITPITMLSSKNVEATTLPLTTTNITQRIVTISTNTDVQTMSTLVTNSSTIVQSALTMQSTDSLTVVTSGESVQPSANAESVMGLSLNPMLSTASTTSMDSQTNSSRVIMMILKENQSSEISSTMMNSDTVTIGTVVISMDADTSTISIPTTDSVAVTQNTMQSANSLTTVTSESVEPSADAENMASSPRMLLPMMNTELVSALSMGQTNMTMMDTTSNQNTQNSEISSAVAININNATRTITNIFPNINVTEISNMNVQIPDASVTVTMPMNDSDRIASMGINDEISTFATNIDVPITTTNVLHSDSSAVADTNTKILMPATTTINMIFINASVIDTFNTTTTKALMSTTSTTLNSASVTVSTSVNTIANSSIDSQLTEILTMPDTVEVTTLRDLTTMPFTTDVNDTVMVTLHDDEITSSLQRINFTSGDTVGNLDNSAIANSMINSISNNEIIVNSTMNSALADINQALVNQSIVSLNRKRRTTGTATVELELDLNMMNDITIKSRTTNKLNNPNRSNLYKRTAKGSRRYFSSYPDEGIWMQDLEIWKSYSAKSNESSMGDITEISFLVNDYDVSSVSASRYVAVLPFAYFPSLHAVALEFPLDDPRYNIILLMPTDKTNTHHLARNLNGKSLRLLRKQLQPTWVRATIPSFMLRGFVTLTSFLQRLGILDVFDPRVADLSPMTSDLGVYVRDIQQNIGINIRNYMQPDRTHSRNGLFERAGPVPFTVLHPFLYFIVDTETSVSLITGRIDDPLNSRIL
ncbi:hypothetical protein HN011_004572 [Eciton burchellii]|nr:hypothetical protein HN011_004572 [Eciton burchellii]